MSKKIVYAGIETGGTKVVVSIAEDTPTNIILTQIFPTRTPNETLQKVVKWLSEHKIDSLGIASFGPLDLRITSPTYGFMQKTPKPGWAGVDILGPFTGMVSRTGKNVPVYLQTDVNAAALGEMSYGNHGSISSLCYVTVGTGCGVGIINNRKPLIGNAHPEPGHYIVRRHPSDTYKGNCPFHSDCLEGLINARSVADRLGCKPLEIRNFINENSQLWDYIVYYIAQLCVTLTLTISPEVIVFGGGIMQRSYLYTRIRKVFLQLINQYSIDSKFIKNINKYIVQSNHGELAGPIGSLELAFLAYNTQNFDRQSKQLTRSKF